MHCSAVRQGTDCLVLVTRLQVVNGRKHHEGCVPVAGPTGMVSIFWGTLRGRQRVRRMN